MIPLTRLIILLFVNTEKDAKKLDYAGMFAGNKIINANRVGRNTLYMCVS